MGVFLVLRETHIWDVCKGYGMAQFYAVQTTGGQEQSVVDAIINSGIPGVYAALAPHSMNSYVIVEAEEYRLVEEAIAGVGNANKVVEGETGFYEVKGFLEPEKDTVDIDPGALVEIQEGAYKGDLARVQRVLSSEEALRVELHEAAVPIPIEVPGEHVRVVDEETESVGN